MKKVLLLTFLVYAVCITSVLLLNEVLIERQSAKDIEGFAVFSFMYFIVMVGLIYWPALSFINKKFSADYTKVYPLIAGIILNIPFFIYAVLMSGKAFQPTEAALFSLMFVVIGFAFGKLYGNHKPRKHPA